MKNIYIVFFNDNCFFTYCLFWSNYNLLFWKSLFLPWRRRSRCSSCRFWQKFTNNWNLFVIQFEPLSNDTNPNQVFFFHRIKIFVTRMMISRNIYDYRWIFFFQACKRPYSCLGDILGITLDLHSFHRTTNATLEHHFKINKPALQCTTWNVDYFYRSRFHVSFHNAFTFNFWGYCVLYRLFNIRSNKNKRQLHLLRQNGSWIPIDQNRQGGTQRALLA